MVKQLLAFLLPVAALAGPGLVGQSLVAVPASHAAIDGSSSTNVPFGRSVPTRVQYVYDGSLFAGPGTITAVAFRLDGGTTAAAKVVDCELSLSTSPLSLINLSADFAQNRGGNATVVVPRQLLTLPAQALGAVPNPFLAPIPLTTPFAYDPAQGPLVLEIVVFGQPPGTYTFDVTYVCTSPELPVGPASCVGSNGLQLAVASTTPQVIWGRPWVPQLRFALPTTLAVLSLGTFDSAPWGGLLLPQDLQVLGAPGCYLSIDMAATFLAVTGTDGSATFPFVVPNEPLLLGEWFRFQGGALDLQANVLGLVTSQAQKVQVCGWEPVARVWSNGITPTIGTREIGLSAVVQFTVQ